MFILKTANFSWNKTESPMFELKRTMVFSCGKLKVSQQMLLPSKYNIYKNFCCEAKVLQNLVLFAFCIFWSRRGWSNYFCRTLPRQTQENVFIFVNRCTVMFVKGVWKQTQKNSEIQHVEFFFACHIYQKVHLLRQYHQTRLHQFFASKISPTVMSPIFLLIWRQYGPEIARFTSC